MQQFFDKKSDLVSISAFHINNILKYCFEHNSSQRAVVIHDNGCNLNGILSEAYRQNLPETQFFLFDEVTPEYIFSVFESLQPKDLVVLIQSTHFRLEAYRLRVELFKKQLKVIEHPHLNRMSDDQIAAYIDSLAYDPAYFRHVGPAIKRHIDAASSGTIISGPEAQLYIDGAFESAKLNIGDYSAMENIGGQFPIGEVFTEAKDLKSVHGRIQIGVFGDKNFLVNRPNTPITLVIEKGRVVDILNNTPEFEAVMHQIREHEGEIWLREIGFGLNRAFSPTRLVNDVGTYERMCGIHFSLGAKHGQYNKPHLRRADARFHIDVFATTHSVILDKQEIFKNNQWTV